MITQNIYHNDRQNPPGPRSLPFIGCSPQLARNPLQFLTDTANKYGYVAYLG